MRSLRAVVLVLLWVLPGLLLITPAAAEWSEAPYYARGDHALRLLAQSHGWPGDGSAGDPVVVSGLSVDGGDHPAFSLGDTRLHVIVRNSTFAHSGDVWEDAVVLRNVTNLTFAGNSVTGGFFGIFVDGGYDVVIAENVVAQANYGVFVFGRANRIRIEDNLLTLNLRGASVTGFAADIAVARNEAIDNAVEGIAIAFAERTIVEENDVQGGASGISVALTAKDTLVRGNRISDAIVGIDLSGWEQDVVEANHIMGAVSCGIRIGWGTDFIVRANRVEGGEAGICLKSASGNVVENNAVDGARHGITVGQADDIVGPSRHNFIANNSVSGGVTGVTMMAAEENHFWANRLEDNMVGISFGEFDPERMLVFSSGDVARNIIARNIIEWNTVGLQGEGGEGNVIYDNLFANLKNVALKGGSLDAWWVAPTTGPNIVGGPRVGGNFWNDHAAPDLDNDGFSDQAYHPAGPLAWGEEPAVDRFPLVRV